MSALMTTDRSTFAQMDGLLAGNAAIRCARTDVLTPRSAHFDDICAELRSYGSTQKNEFEVGEDAHIMLMRCDGTSSRCEILWLDDGHRPEAMRGTGEGHYPWDLQPKSTMTNANVEQVVTGVDGHTLTVKYKDGDKKIIVPPDVPIVTFAPGDKADLRPGTKIFIGASKKLPDGTLQAARVNYGKDGLTPPM
jgi:hypothetical protein